jgi:hypothetical protein
MDLAYYYFSFDAPPGQAPSAQVQTICLGLTDQLEIDLQRYDIQGADPDTIVNATVSLARETQDAPDLVVGGRNIGASTVGGVPGSDRKSWFAAMAKTLETQYGSRFGASVVIRLHAGYGTRDHTFLDEDRHEGLFGGVQALLTPKVGAVALHDGQDLITGLSFSPQGTSLTLKGGTYGEHWWAGLSWAK